MNSTTDSPLSYAHPGLKAAIKPVAGIVLKLEARNTKQELAVLTRETTVCRPVEP